MVMLILEQYQNAISFISPAMSGLFIACCNRVPAVSFYSILVNQGLIVPGKVLGLATINTQYIADIRLIQDSSTTVKFGALRRSV